MAPSAIGERVQCQARATPSGPIRFAIPRPSGGIASMSMSAPVTVAPRYKPPSFSTGALCRPASVSRQSRHRPPSQRRNRKLYDFQSCLRVLWNRGGAGCQRRCDRPPDPECRDRPSERAECRFARRLRTIGIGMVVASLILFAIGMTVAADALENLVRSLDIAA